MKRTLRSWMMIAACLFWSHGVIAVQVCNTDAPVIAPDSRYTDNGDGTVTDHVTDLMWMQCAAPTDCSGALSYTWLNALQLAQDVNANSYAGYNDWRLPNLKEMLSLVAFGCRDPAINLNFFPYTPSAFFWTSSPHVDAEQSAWMVSFTLGHDQWAQKTDGHFVRLVRGGR